MLTKLINGQKKLDYTNTGGISKQKRGKLATQLAE